MGDAGLPFMTFEEDKWKREGGGVDRKKRRREGEVSEGSRDGGGGRVAIVLSGGYCDISSCHSLVVQWIFVIGDRHAVHEIAFGTERRLCRVAQSCNECPDTELEKSRSEQSKSIAVVQLAHVYGVFPRPRAPQRKAHRGYFLRFEPISTLLGACKGAEVRSNHRCIPADEHCKS